MATSSRAELDSMGFGEKRLKSLKVQHYFEVINNAIVQVRFFGRHNTVMIATQVENLESFFMVRNIDDIVFQLESGARLINFVFALHVGWIVH